MTKQLMEALYLPASIGRNFCVLHSPTAGVKAKGALVYVHPFAEEMNKARRMAAMQARALADIGWYVLQPDLHGCGDSEGDFGDATWERWIEDVLHSAHWVQQRTGIAPGLWGLRAGCLLAAGVAPHL